MLLPKKKNQFDKKRKEPHNMHKQRRAANALYSEVSQKFSELPSVKSPVDSVVGSTETETDSLAGLTRELARSSLQEKTQNIKVASPPATALGGKIQSRDVVYAAVEQAVRLKMNGEGPPKGMRLLGPHRNLSFVHYLTQPAKNTDIGFHANEGLS